MKKPSLVFGFLVGLFAACLFFALLPSKGDGGSDVRLLKIAHSQPTSHPVHAGIVYFAERVAHYSGGRLRFTVFPNGQLGDEGQTLEQLQTGTLAVAKVGGAELGNFVPVAKVFSLPYLFRDEAHYWAALNGAVGRDMLEALATIEEEQPSGFRGLTYFDAGSRNFYAEKPIRTPEDLIGLKIRVQSDPVAIDTVRALGASPTPIAWGELYTALQQGVVDGAENNPPSFVSSRHFEVCKAFSFDHHSRVPDILMISSNLWDSLDEEARGWLDQAAAEASDFQRKAWQAVTEEAIKMMKAEGVQVYESEVPLFIEATESVRAKYASGPIKEFMDRIQKVAE